MRKETRCRHIGYSYRLTARVLLYAPSHRQDNTYHSLCYTCRGTLAGTRNSSMGPLWGIDTTTHRTMSERSYHGATSHSLARTRNSSMCLPWGIDLMTHHTKSRHSYHGSTSHSLARTRNSSMGPPWGIDLTTHCTLTIELHLTPLAGTKNTSMCLPWRIDLMTHHTKSRHSYHWATSHSLARMRNSSMGDRSDDPPLLPSD